MLTFVYYIVHLQCTFFKQDFAINTGVLQGDTLALFFIIMILDYVLSHAVVPELDITLCPCHGSHCPESYLTDLNFIEDIALISHTVTNAQLSSQTWSWLSLRSISQQAAQRQIL